MSVLEYVFDPCELRWVPLAVIHNLNYPKNVQYIAVVGQFSK